MIVRADSLMKGERLNTVLQSKLPKTQNSAKNPTLKNISPTRLTVKAFMADLFAWIRVNQKLISKQDDTPIPSQPKNITKQLSPATSTSIKKVNMDR